MGKRSQWRRARLLQISKREQITAYNPTPELIAAAEERTAGMVEYFRLAVREADWNTGWDYLERLVRSAYLQGAQDAANVAAQWRKDS
jgi:hypothetical protein